MLGFRQQEDGFLGDLCNLYFHTIYINIDIHIVTDAAIRAVFDGILAGISR